MANIQEIADLAGVSIATVSRVINKHPYVRESTRQKVLRIMEELDYVPNANAISLKKGETHLIGIIATSFSSIIVTFVQAFIVFAERHGFNISLFITNEDPEKELVALEMLKRKQLDAILCLIRSNSWDIIESYAQYGPIVTWQRVLNEKLPSVFMEQYQIYFNGLEYLYSKGYRKILSVYPMTEGLNTRERIRAHRDFVQKHQLNANQFPHIEEKLSVPDGEELADWWISQKDRPDAIFCANDEVAAGLAKALRTSGFSIPGDLGIMGFNNSVPAQLLDLTTINYPVGLQAENAFIIICNKLNQTENALNSLEFTLVERKST
ncbi:LacI family DNA-binding transcriptional regulator [Paenibacillus polymyxa]|uniref:LacI family DNA-binding transcriptional regulator n=1 Tax=Paenibacillus polymyxa TaxID=1406 RepID=UPI003B5B9C02